MVSKSNKIWSLPSFFSGYDQFWVMNKKKFYFLPGTETIFMTGAKNRLFSPQKTDKTLIIPWHKWRFLLLNNGIVSKDLGYQFYQIVPRIKLSFKM